MKRYLAVVTLVLMILMVLAGCSGMMEEESEPFSSQESPAPSIELSWPETLPSLDDDVFQEDIQQTYERYCEVIDQHGKLVKMGNVDLEFFSIKLKPVVEDTSVSSALVTFKRDGTKSLNLDVSGYTESYLKELLALTLLAIDPGMEYDQAVSTAEDLYSFSRKAERKERMDLGNYSIYYSKRLDIWMSDTFYFKSTKTVYDKYKFNKSEYKELTYDVMEKLQDFEVFEKYTDKLVYIEGKFTGISSLDSRKSEIIDQEGNIFLINYDYDKIGNLEKESTYRLYGELKISIEELVYLDVQYPYGY